MIAFQVNSPRVEKKQMASNKDDGCYGKSFSAKNMSELFQKCAKSNNAQEVDMDCYLAAWEELIRFLFFFIC